MPVYMVEAEVKVMIIAENSAVAAEEATQKLDDVCLDVNVTGIS